MKETSPAHQHYPRDFFVETQDMSPEACGIYVWLRGRCWLDGSIPANIGDLARSCKTNSKGMARAWSQMAHLFQKDGDRMIHPGIETLRKEQADNREKKSHAGKVGAESRWQTHSRRIAGAFDRNGNSVTNDSSASASASALGTANAVPMRVPSLPEAFDLSYWTERLYARHPKKKNKPLVEQVCRQIAVKARADPDAKFRQIDAAHELWCRCPDWTKENAKYCPKLDEWLADEGFTGKPNVVIPDPSARLWREPKCAEDC